MRDYVLAKFMRVLIQHLAVSHAITRGKILSYFLIIHFAVAMS